MYVIIYLSRWISPQPNNKKAIILHGKYVFTNTDLFPDHMNNTVMNKDHIGQEYNGIESIKHFV